MDNTSGGFWKRPEGTTAKFIVGGLVAAFTYALYVALPFLITIVENTLYLGFLIAVVAAVYFTLTSKRMRTLIFLALQAVSRAITGIFVNLDPVGILESFVKDLQNKREEVKEAITEIRTTRAETQKTRDAKVREMQQALNLAEVASQRGDALKMQELTAKVGRRKATVENIDNNLVFVNQTVSTLEELDRVIEFHINNSVDEIESLKTDNKMALAMIAASKSANAALGDTDLLDVKNMAVEVIQNRVAMATGQIESIMHATKTMRGDMDLTNMAYAADGQKMLDEMRQSLSQIDKTPLSGGTPLTLTSGAAQPVVSSSNRWAKSRNSQK